MKEEVEVVILEDSLEKDTTQIVEAVSKAKITNQEDYLVATEYLKNIKAHAKDIETFFRDIKANTYKSWKDICAKEKSYLDPLNNAESKIKKLMVDYQLEQDIAKRLAEAKELEEQQSKVAELKANGKEDEAEALSSQSIQSVSEAKVEGISYQVDYEIIILDEVKVPVEISGTIIRPIDTNIIKQLAKVSKGNIKIDGIEIKETKIAKVRV